MDRRQQKTRDAIYRALNELLKEKRFSKITVQEIIDEANVGRSTFYAHFQTKDDLLRQMCSDIADHVVSGHLESEPTHDFSDEVATPRAVFAHFFQHLKDNEDSVVELVRSDSGALFLRYLKEALETVVEREYGLEISRVSSVPRDLVTAYVSSTCVEVFAWWVDHGMEDPAADVARCFNAFVEPVMGSLGEGEGRQARHAS